jgi:hypothetical protein
VRPLHAAGAATVRRDHRARVIGDQAATEHATVSLLPLLAPPAAVIVAVGLAVGIAPRGEPAAPGSPVLATSGSGGRLDGTSNTEARVMRRATRRLGAELGAAARCDPRRPPAGFAVCVGPALRHAGIGGRTAALLLRGVLAGVPAGRCRAYLLRLQAANDAAGDEARWLLPTLYEVGRRRRQREVAVQMALAGGMLRRAARAATPGVCASGAGGPAA